MYRKHGLEIIVRPPHTTHVLQPEDVVSFRPLKIAFRAAKAKLLIDQGLKGHKVGITGEHMLGLLKVAWESAFCREKVVQAWKVTGYIPFTRRVYWNLLRKEEATAATLAEAGRVDPSYKESLGLIAASGGNTAGFAAEHGAGGEGEGGEEEEEMAESGRITSKDMWTDALTSDQANEMAKVRNEKRLAKVREATATKENAASKRAKKVADSVALVPEALEALEALTAPVDLSKLTVAHLYALIRSKGQIPDKGKKGIQVEQLKALLA